MRSECIFQLWAFGLARSPLLCYKPGQVTGHRSCSLCVRLAFPGVKNPNSACRRSCRSRATKFVNVPERPLWLTRCARAVFFLTTHSFDKRIDGLRALAWRGGNLARLYRRCVHFWSHAHANRSEALVS